MEFRIGSEDISGAWTDGRATAEAGLGALLGSGRARALLCLDGPRTTSEVAVAGDLAISTASHHLAVLRKARLVDARRDGARVWQVRTLLGEALVGGRG